MKELAAMRTKLRDIEECKREFINIRKRYTNLLESAPDALVFVNTEGNIVLGNAQLAILFGYTEEELVGKNLDVLIPARFRERHLEHLKDFFLHPRIRRMGTGLGIFGLRKDGTEFPADISLSLLETEDGLLTTGAIRDITQQKHVEELIERNYHIQRVISSVLKISLEPIPLGEQMERILDLLCSVPGLALQSKGAIYLVEDEPDVLVLKTTRKSPELSQLPCEKIAFGKCLCGQAAAACETVFADCVDDRHEIHYRSAFPHGHYCVPIVSAGEILGLINVFVSEGHTRNAEEEEFLASVANTLAGVITREKAAHEKARLQAQLADAEKLSALGRITANVADEIRNPLTSVGGFARRLNRKIPEGTTAKEYADFIISEVARMERILHDVLTFSRGGGLHREEHVLYENVEDALKTCEQKCREQSIEIRKSFADVPHLSIDREQVLEAVKHLLSNAIDAMPHGGTLIVDVERGTLKEPPLVVVRISDTGEGIPEDRMKLIFEPFFTTKVQPKGTGLGLPVAKKVVEDHGGFIEVKSAPGSGSTLSLHFPTGTQAREKQAARARNNNVDG